MKHAQASASFIGGRDPQECDIARAGVLMVPGRVRRVVPPLGGPLPSADTLWPKLAFSPHSPISGFPLLMKHRESVC